MNKIEKIRWIASYPKSGNTWVRTFLEAYLTGTLDINNMKATRGDTSTIEYQQVACVPVDRVHDNIVLQYRTAALMNMVIRQDGVNPPIFKTHHAQTKVFDVQMIPPELSHSAVYIVRDPRDIAPSFSAHMGQDMDTSIHQLGHKHTILSHEGSMKHFIGSWSDHVKSWENGIKTCRIRYEDLRDDPFNGFGVILENFELPINKQRIGKALKLCEIDKLRKQEQRKGFRENIRDTKFFGGEREKLTSKQRTMIELTHGETMTKLEYEVNHGSNDKIRQLSTSVVGR